MILAIFANLHFFWKICIFCKFAILQSLCFLPAGEVDPGGVGARVPREPRPLREVVDLFFKMSLKSNFFVVEFSFSFSTP